MSISSNATEPPAQHANAMVKLLRAAPRLEPPCDDESSPGAPPRLTLIIGGKPTAIPPLEQPPSAIPSHSMTPQESYMESGNPFERKITPSDKLPNVKAHIRGLTFAMLEMLAGRRPLHRLNRWLHESLYLTLWNAHARQGETPPSRRSFLHRTKDRAASTPRIRGVHTSQPAPNVVEASVVVTEDDRAYAVALRLEGLDNRWQCTVFELV